MLGPVRQAWTQWPTAVLIVVAGMAVAGLSWSCGGEAGLAYWTGDGTKLKVVATTSLLADLVHNVGGDRVEVQTILPPGADVHSFQTTPLHSVAIGEADLIVSNGNGLDSFLDPILQGSRF